MRKFSGRRSGHGRLALGLMVLMASLASATAANAAEGDRMQRSVTVSATGSVNAVPDIARISSGVVTEAVSAREALSANTALVRKLTDALKESGVAPADMQTSSITVSPRYVHNTEGRAPRIDGYSV
ncbi:MAG: SIMPL domain-containing protein, partial [Hyphomicrobiaceae bacterium]